MEENLPSCYNQVRMPRRTDATDEALAMNRGHMTSRAKGPSTPFTLPLKKKKWGTLPISLLQHLISVLFGDFELPHQDLQTVQLSACTLNLQTVQLSACDVVHGHVRSYVLLQMHLAHCPQWSVDSWHD